MRLRDCESGLQELEEIREERIIDTDKYLSSKAVFTYTTINLVRLIALIHSHKE